MSQSDDYLKMLLTDMNNRLSDLSEKQSEMNAILAKNTLSLEKHERRSTNLEAFVKHLDLRVSSSLKKQEVIVDHLESDISSIKQHVTQVQKIVNIFSFLSTYIPNMVKFLLMLGSLFAGIWGVIKFIYPLIEKVK